MCHQDPFATLQNANCSFNLQPVFVLAFGGVTWNVPYWCWEVSCVRIGYYLNQFLCYCQEIYSFAIELYSQKCQCCVFYSYLLVSSTIVDLKEEIALAITDLAWRGGTSCQWDDIMIPEKKTDCHFWLSELNKGLSLKDILETKKDSFIC